MPSYKKIVSGFFALSTATALQTSAQHTGAIPVRKLTPAISTDSGVVSNVYVIRVLADGRVLLNDGLRRRVLLLDTTLKKFTVVADTAGESRQTFGNSNGGLLPYRGDS